MLVREACVGKPGHHVVEAAARRVPSLWMSGPPFILCQGKLSASASFAQVKHNLRSPRRSCSINDFLWLSNASLSHNTTVVCQIGASELTCIANVTCCRTSSQQKSNRFTEMESLRLGCSSHGIIWYAQSLLCCQPVTFRFTE